MCIGGSLCLFVRKWHGANKVKFFIKLFASERGYVHQCRKPLLERNYVPSSLSCFQNVK
jgi:hypothetical protein